MKRFVLLLYIASLLAGCTWVELSPGANSVRVITSAQAARCERLGSATAKSMSKVAFIERDSEKLAAELSTLARNEAANMGGNAIVPETKAVEGRQRFGVYRCPTPLSMPHSTPHSMPQ